MGQSEGTNDEGDCGPGPVQTLWKESKRYDKVAIAKEKGSKRFLNAHGELS